MKVVFFGVFESTWALRQYVVPYRLFLLLSPKRLSAAAYNDFVLTTRRITCSSTCFFPPRFRSLLNIL